MTEQMSNIHLRAPGDPVRVMDAHVHFRDPSRLQYPSRMDVPAHQRECLPGDLSSFADGTVDGVIVMEGGCRPADNIGELDFLESVADEEPRVCGVVAFVDLCDAADRKRNLARIGSRDRVVGVRHAIRGHDRGFSLQAEFVRGVQEVGAIGRTFALSITPDQLLEARALVQLCPGTQFVLDHCARPAIRSDGFEPWATDIARLAECGNVACKLSGLALEARADALFRYVRHVMLHFGATRLLYGSDWPHVSAGGEGAWRNVVERLISDWTPAARQAFFLDNAVRLYGLRQPATASASS
ncbi:MAG: amidohydrolase 2 [Gemmatimonadetes bacterium]|nr:amidohydrolase 2 [Gemmatimonadota bacterium]